MTPQQRRNVARITQILGTGRVRSTVKDRLTVHADEGPGPVAKKGRKGVGAREAAMREWREAQASTQPPIAV